MRMMNKKRKLNIKEKFMNDMFFTGAEYLEEGYTPDDASKEYVHPRQKIFCKKQMLTRGATGHEIMTISSYLRKIGLGSQYGNVLAKVDSYLKEDEIGVIINRWQGDELDMDVYNINTNKIVKNCSIVVTNRGIQIYE